MSNVSGAWFAPFGLATPRMAVALPVPTNEPFGQPLSWPCSSFASLQVGKPLGASLRVLGRLMSRWASVALGLPFWILKLRSVLFGLFFVPAFDGETDAVSVADSELWA